MKRTKQTIKADERFLTLQEAAPRLHLHPQTVKLKCESGEIRATKPGRRWLIPEAALGEFLSARTVAIAA